MLTIAFTGDFLKDARTLLRDLEQMGSEELDDGIEFVVVWKLVMY